MWLYYCQVLGLLGLKMEKRLLVREDLELSLPGKRAGGVAGLKSGFVAFAQQAESFLKLLVGGDAECHEDPDKVARDVRKAS